MRPIHRAAVLRGTGRGDHGSGKAVVRAASPSVFALPGTAGERIHLQLEFVGPLAGVGAHVVRVARQGQRARGQPLHFQHVGALVHQAAVQLKYVVGVQRQVQGQAQLGHRVVQVDGDALACLQRFNAAIGECLGKLLPAAVRQQRALHVPAHAKSGRHGQRLVKLHAAGRNGSAIAQRRHRQAVLGQARTPVAPQGRLVGAVFQHHGGVAAMQKYEVGRAFGRVAGHGGGLQWQ